MTLQLYCFGESGHSYKVALMLTLAGLEWQPIFVDFFHGEARSPAFKAINALGELPVLVDGPLRLTQSGVILGYLSEKTGQFAAGSVADRLEVQRWLFWDNHKFSTQCGTTRFLLNFVPPEKRPAEVIAYQQARLKTAYQTLDQHLQEREWVVGAAVTIADLSLCAYLYYPEPFGFSRRDWPHIDAWLDRIAALPGWKHPYELMPGNPADRA